MMNSLKSLTLAAVAVSAVCAFAEPQGGQPSGKMVKIGDKLVPVEKIRESVRRASERKTGGRIRRANSASGWFILVNAAKDIPVETLNAVLAVIEKRAKVMTKTVAADGCKSADAKAAIAKAGGKLGVLLVSEVGAPSLVVAPEDGWAVVNTTALAAGNPAPDVLQSRIRKELLRAFAFVAGGAYAARGDFLMRDVKTPQDLDGLRMEDFGIDLLRRFEEGIPSYGITPWHETTYLRACQEGWAPAPTNDAQRAIWEKVHAIPDKPMTIKYDPKIDK